VALAAPLAAQVPERSAGGQTLDVPDGQLGAGQAYYLLDGDTQLSIRSRAELQGVTLTTGRAVGYLVGPFVEDAVEDGLAQPILAGALRIPTHSLRSGVAATDAQLHDAALLDIAGHPEITVRFVGLSAVEPVPVPAEQAGELVRVKAKAAVAVAFKGAERPLEVPVELSFRLSSFPAMSRMVGDLATLASSFELTLADWGVEVPPPLALLVAPSVTVDVFLAFSTVKPDDTVILIPREQYLTESRIRVLLRDQRQTREGYALVREHLKAHWADPVVLNRVVSDIVDLEDVERRNWALLREAAERADELTAGEDAGVLGTLARIQFELGDVDRAVEIQRRAVAQLAGAEERARAAASAQLERYEAALPAAPTP
jgi:hypothetical protein